jgi:hypothetical protein
MFEGSIVMVDDEIGDKIGEKMMASASIYLRQYQLESPIKLDEVE